MGIVRKAATAAAVSGRLPAPIIAKRRASGCRTAPAAAPAAPADDTSAKLEELADLHAKGVLSDENSRRPRPKPSAFRGGLSAPVSAGVNRN